MTASQTTLATVEGDSSATRAQLAESDTRVTGKIFRRNLVPLSFCSVVLFLTTHVLLTVALTEQLEALQLTTNNAAMALSARGDLLANRL